jgi:hypothetical protein
MHHYVGKNLVTTLSRVVQEISLDTFASGLSEENLGCLIISGFGYPKLGEEDVRPPDAAVKYGYNAVIVMVNSNKSCRKAWERSVEDNKSNPSILVQDRLNPENYTEDDERAAALLNLSNVGSVIVHDAPGSWPVTAALHEAVKRYHPDNDILAYFAKASYNPPSRGEQMARELGMPIFPGQINESRTPVPQDNLPETPGFKFSESCRIYVPSR